jgi:hypothetical protein
VTVTGDRDFILVEGGDKDSLGRAVTENTSLYPAELPSSHLCEIFAVAGGSFVLRFDPALPPYAFTNLLGWVADPANVPGVRGAVGWIRSPSSGQRYVFRPDVDNPAGDTLRGVSAAGEIVSLYLPETTLTVVARSGGVFDPPRLPVLSGAPATVFEVTVDADPSFGNPGLVV